MPQPPAAHGAAEPTPIDDFRAEAGELSAALASAAEALRETGAAPSPALIGRATSYGERLRVAAGTAAQPDITLDDLALILERQQTSATTLAKLTELNRVRAVVAGYEGPLDKLRQHAADAL